MNSKDTIPKRYCIILNNNHKYQQYLFYQHYHQMGLLYSKSINKHLTKFVLNKFKHKYKISKKKLKLYLEDGTDLLTDYDLNENINDIDEFDNNIGHCINIYVSNGESFTKNILMIKRDVINDKNENVLIKQIPNAVVTRLIGKQSKHIHSIAGTNGISGVV